MRTAEAHLIGAQALQQIEGVDLTIGSLDTLTDLRTEAEAKFSIAEAMVPNLRQEGLTNDPTFNPSGTTQESGSTSGERHAELREKLLATFEAGYDSYEAGHTAKRANSESRRAVTKSEALEELQEDLTIDVLDVIAADMVRHKDDPRAGFDVIMRSNEDYTAEAETAIAEYLQADLPYDGASYLNQNYHNKKTAARAVDNGKKLLFAYAPRHSNVPDGTVKEQKAWLEAQNADAAATLRSPEDVEAMTHFRVLLDQGELNNPETRFDKTYSRKVEDYKEKNGRPVGGSVPRVCVGDGGRLYRHDSHVKLINASRVLVVSNPSL